MTGKVECGQGARAELTQASAEELRVGVDRVRLVMADTDLVPDDGGTYGSRRPRPPSPPSAGAAPPPANCWPAWPPGGWGSTAQAVEFREGRAVDAASGRSVGYDDLAARRGRRQGVRLGRPRRRRA